MRILTKFSERSYKDLLIHKTLSDEYLLNCGFNGYFNSENLFHLEIDSF